MDIHENIYRTNGFRILGLDITSKNRKIDNRISKINRYRERKDFNDTEPLVDVFKNSKMDFLLPVSPEPSYNEYQDAKNRLKDVETRLIDEIFWFWPKSFDSDLDDEIVGYLKDGEYYEAISYWNDTSISNTMNMTSIHNLAVLYHVRALDGFIDGDGDIMLFDDLELSLNYWSRIIDSNNFKNFVKERVNTLNHPRLTEKFVDEIFEELPYDLLNINYIFIKKYLDSSNITKTQLDCVSNFIDCIQNSPFDKSVISRVSSKITNLIENSINRNKDSFVRSFESADEKDKFNLLFDYSDEIMPYLSILHDSLSNDTFANNLLNNTCRFLLNKIPTAEILIFMKLVDDASYKKFIDLLNMLYENVTDKALKENIRADLSIDEIKFDETSSDVNSANLNVSVKDQKGNNLIAVVMLSNSETGQKFEEVMTTSGSTTIYDLPKGNYEYKVIALGYEIREGKINIGTGQNSLDIRLDEIMPIVHNTFSYNKRFFIFVAAVILASIAFNVVINML
ncbi:carboxypeptidase-like regulatory domain-containing protein [Methanobrevibacter sp. V74]|uniref:carboxypeptidase-like regulatory domain-containing protein n=1 Tax=Methanobrevibacter sp. V74 TaxID=3064279 RepID=UPI0027368887|nr:carboxypeptidase-like regulatory domain-containing protein [Methanobrevibacter sp. V74]